MKAKDYLRLIKPGIVIGNSLHFIVGVLIAVPLSWSQGASALVGLLATALLIASACLVNNWLDRRFDKAMQRTKVRATAQNKISSRRLFTVAGLLGGIGLMILLLWVNPLTAGLGLLAWLSYSLVYTLSKPRTVHSTIIGTLPGALPAVAGYTAVVNQFDSTAWLLLLLIGVWQLPHFYAIAIYRRSDYQAAGLPILSTRVSAASMRRVMVATLLMYAVAASLFAIVALHWLPGLIIISMAIWWLSQAWPYDTKQHEAWARRLFVGSMKVSLGLLVVSLVHFTLVWFT